MAEYCLYRHTGEAIDALQLLEHTVKTLEQHCACIYVTLQAERAHGPVPACREKNAVFWKKNISINI